MSSAKFHEYEALALLGLTVLFVYKGMYGLLLTTISLFMMYKYKEDMNNKFKQKMVSIARRSKNYRKIVAQKLKELEKHSKNTSRVCSKCSKPTRQQTGQPNLMLYELDDDMSDYRI